MADMAAWLGEPPVDRVPGGDFVTMHHAESDEAGELTMPWRPPKMVRALLSFFGRSCAGAETFLLAPTPTIRAR